LRRRSPAARHPSPRLAAPDPGGDSRREEKCGLCGLWAAVRNPSRGRAPHG
jgi:hypothetical protein